MNEYRKEFFDDLKDCYRRENQEISWTWDEMASSASEDILFYLAFNLSKNILHGPLPERLHNRMVLESNNFCKSYFKYLSGNGC